jgi:hypothetical protein
MTSEEESNLLCACHLLNCDEGQGQWDHRLWYKDRKKIKRAWRLQGLQGVVLG